MTAEDVKKAEAADTNSKLLKERKVKKWIFIEYKIIEFKTDVKASYRLSRKKQKLDTIVYALESPCLGRKDMQSCYEALVEKLEKSGAKFVGGGTSSRMENRQWQTDEAWIEPPWPEKKIKSGLS